MISKKLWARPLSPVICPTCKQKTHVLLIWICAFLHPAREKKPRNCWRSGACSDLKNSVLVKMQRRECSLRAIISPTFQACLLTHSEFSDMQAPSSISPFFSQIPHNEEQLMDLTCPLQQGNIASQLCCSWTAKLPWTQQNSLWGMSFLTFYLNLL